MEMAKKIFGPGALRSAGAHLRCASATTLLCCLTQNAHCSGATSPLTTLSNPAYSLLTDRTVTNRHAFFVYRDADSAYNHGFPSGFFGTISKVHIDTSCINDPNSSSGCSTNQNVFDRQRGNVCKIWFDPLSPGQFAGVNFEEPERWGVTQTGSAYNLTGVTQALVRLRCPTLGGLAVQFGVAGYTSDYILIPQSTTYTMLRLFLDIPPSVLANVHVLFSVAVSVDASPSTGTLLIDWVQLLPVPSRQANALGFPLANETFGVVARSSPGTNREPWALDQLTRNLSTTYESALTASLLLDRGNASDLGAARVILNSFVYALTNDNQGDPLPTTSGWFGLHNGYMAGDLPLFNSQGPGAGQKGDVRLAGFSCGPTSPTGFCVVLDGATGGNVSFAIVALCSGYKVFNDDRYLDAARKAARWIVHFLKDTSPSGYGGFYLGYPDRGEPKILVPSKSVENNADIYSAFRALAELERHLGNNSPAEEWMLHAEAAGDFVIQMFDPALGHFYAGTVRAGTPPGPGVAPIGAQRGNDVINTFDFLDANTFTALALAESPRYRNQLDWRRPVQYVIDHFAQTISASDLTFQGFNIVKAPMAGPNGIAWEFTGQAVQTMNFVDALYGESRFSQLSAFYLNQIHQAQLFAPFGDGRGVVASTVQDGDTLPPIEQCLSTPYQCIPQRVGLAATTWAILAEGGINPLSPNFAFRFTHIERGNDNIVMRFNTLAGRAYRIEWSSNLTSWNVLYANVQGTGDEVEVTDATTGGISQRFYRARLNPIP